VTFAKINYFPEEEEEEEKKEESSVPDHALTLRILNEF